MPKRRKGKLTDKEEAVIRDVVKSVNEGEKLSVTRSVERIHDVTSRASASAIASRKMSKAYFRDALMDALEKRNIIGADSKVEQVLVEGLDAENKGEPDHKTRLEFAKEVNKISGVYAPERKQIDKRILNMDMSKEELTEKINRLQSELE